MTRSALAGAATVLVAGGVALGWFASRPDRSRSSEGVSAEIAPLRTAADEQAAKIRRLEDQTDPAAETAQLLAALREQSARIERLERAPPPPDAVAPAVDAGTKAVLENLKAVTDGGKTVALQDGLAALVHAGDAAVPDIAALLRSGFDREYGGGLLMKGNAVQSYPNLRIVLMDALRQIGTPAATDALSTALSESDRPTDCAVMWMYQRAGPGAADPAIARGLSALATSVLKRVAANGLDSIDCETSSGPAVSLMFWITWNPRGEDAPALEQIVLRGRPKDGMAGEIFRKFIPVFVEVAPEKAARAALRVYPGFGLAEMSQSGVGDVSKASQLRYYEVLFAQGVQDANVRFELYSCMPYLDERIKDPAQRVADAQPFVRFLESRVNAEVDPVGKAGAEKALKQLREAIEHAQKQ